MYILLSIFSFYMLFFKFVYLGSCINLELRKIHSKSFLKKNKSKSFFDNVFYIRYKKEINRCLYYGNIIYFIAGLSGYFVLILSYVLKNEYLAEIYTVFLVVLSVFSILIWITTSMLNKVKTYSVIQKVLYIGLYIIIILYWIVSTICAVIRFI